MQPTSKAKDRYFSTVPGDSVAFIPKRHNSASFVAVYIGYQHSQPYTNSHYHCVTITESTILQVFFIVAPCMLIVFSSLFVQPMHTNYYKIVKQIKSFKIILVAPTCFGLHKPSPGSSLRVLHWSYNVDFGYIYRYMKLSVLWLHMQ